MHVPYKESHKPKQNPLLAYSKSYKDSSDANNEPSIEPVRGEVSKTSNFSDTLEGKHTGRLRTHTGGTLGSIALSQKKNFWSFIKNLKRDSTGIGTLQIASAANAMQTQIRI